MTDRRPPTPPLDASLEALVMDWVDGVVSDAQGEAAARAAGRPDLIPLVAAMKADMAALADVACVTPPRFDFADVQARLEQADRLEQVIHHEQAPARPIEMHRHRRTTRTTWKLPAWPLAMAAGVLLAAMIATQVGRVSSTPATPAPLTPFPSAPGPFAMESRPPEASQAAATRTFASDTATLAMQPVAATVHELDATAASIPARLVIGADRAMELAREGRLLVRVAAVGEEPAMPPLDVMLASESAWRVSDDVSRELLAAVRPFFGADAGVKPEVVVGPPEERFLSADIFGPAELESLGGVHATRAATNAFHAATYVVRLDDDRRVLDQLRRTITTRAAANVLFEEIPGGVRDAAGDDPLDAGSLVPGRRGIAVPVIVERR